MVAFKGGGASAVSGSGHAELPWHGALSRSAHRLLVGHLACQQLPASSHFQAEHAQKLELKRLFGRLLRSRDNLDALQASVNCICALLAWTLGGKDGVHQGASPCLVGLCCGLTKASRLCKKPETTRTCARLPCLMRLRHQRPCLFMHSLKHHKAVKQSGVSEYEIELIGTDLHQHVRPEDAGPQLASSRRRRFDKNVGCPRALDLAFDVCKTCFCCGK